MLRHLKLCIIFVIGLHVALIALAIVSLATAQTRIEMVDGDKIVIIDGDTVALPCPADIGLCRSERIRILNIDAPETGRARCEPERIAGLAAKAALAGLIRGRSVTVTRCEPDTGRCTDRYGRTLARLTTPAGDIGQALVAKGLALPWRTGREAAKQRAAHWCKDPSQ